ncbi:hypothetical protein E3A20_24840 [Planctomyces bekefii]|jgi:hypothetical protein|uniref:Phage protein n=1 Tax=Planctomyces bekefii TaxID=1653850 RepID=A0A5C6M0Y4_9PLAN|nr:hypothetical protein E3A20_24840 [Planctomyces bekefii]
MEQYFVYIQLVVTVAILIGVYKNKIDSHQDKMKEFNDLSERLARLEEKVNFLIEQAKKNQL